MGEPTPPPTPPPEPVQIPWRDRYQFEPMGPTLGRTNIIESAIRQIQDENILPIGHYPKDGFVNDHFTEARSSSRLSNTTEQQQIEVSRTSAISRTVQQRDSL